MNTLKEVLVDAARYRWLRENVERFNEFLASVEYYCEGSFADRYINPSECDAVIDAELAAANE